MSPAKTTHPRPGPDHAVATGQVGVVRLFSCRLCGALVSAAEVSRPAFRPWAQKSKTPGTLRPPEF